MSLQEPKQREANLWTFAETHRRRFDETRARLFADFSQSNHFYRPGTSVIWSDVSCPLQVTVVATVRDKQKKFANRYPLSALPLEAGQKKLACLRGVTFLFARLRTLSVLNCASNHECFNSCIYHLDKVMITLVIIRQLLRLRIFA